MEKENRNRVYEIGYLLVPTIAEEDIAKESGLLKEAVATSGGSFIAEEFPKLMELAYRMERVIENKKQKFTSGYFGWMKFEMDSAAAEALDDLFEKNPKLVRHLFIKTVRENTYIGKRAPKTEHRRKREEEVDPTKPATAPEELDKQIDALVTE